MTTPLPYYISNPGATDAPPACRGRIIPQPFRLVEPIEAEDPFLGFVASGRRASCFPAAGHA